MTEIVVASRDVTLWDPNTGEGFRIVRGRTLADARHACVTSFPDNWSPMTVDLSVEDDTVSRETAAEADAAASQLAGELFDARTEADAYREQLAAIADEVIRRGLPEYFGIDTEHPGWLVEVVTRALSESDQGAPADEPVPAPARPKRTSRAKAAPANE